MSKIDVQIQKERGSGKSKLRQYQDLIIGNQSVFFLILFEKLTFFIGPLPGPLGILARRYLYRLILGGMGRGVAIGRSVNFRHPRKIVLGDYVAIADDALIDAKGFTNQGISIGSYSSVGVETVLSCKEGDINIGSDTHLGRRCNLSSNSSISIGDGTTLKDGVTIFATSHNFDSVDSAILDQGWTSLGVTVGRDTIIEERVTIVDGVTVGQGCHVMSGSVVTKDIADGTAVSGAPARVVESEANTSDLT